MCFSQCVDASRRDPASPELTARHHVHLLTTCALYATVRTSASSAVRGAWWIAASIARCARACWRASCATSCPGRESHRRPCWNTSRQCCSRWPCWTCCRYRYHSSRISNLNADRPISDLIKYAKSACRSDQALFPRRRYASDGCSCILM